MARTKRPPLVHIPWAPQPAVTGLAGNSQNTPHTEKSHLRREEPSKSVSVSSEIKSNSSTSVETETPAPIGVTECPHCNIDFKDMAVADVRSHVESCSRPTTAGSESDESGLSDPPESPKVSADQLDEDEDEDEDEEAVSDLEAPRGFVEADFSDLPGPYDDDDEDEDEEDEEDEDEGTLSPNEESTSDIKFPKLKDPSEILASLGDIENLSDEELYRRAANVAFIFDTYQREWMALEKITAKATAGDGVPAIRNPRAVRGHITYQDRLEADVYGYVHNPHPNFIGKQDPLGQRQGSSGDGELRSRLRKQTKKAVEADNESDPNAGESGRPTRNRNTPSRFESQSREQTPSVKKPRGRGKGGRVGELRSGFDSRPMGARTGSPLVNGNTSENLPSLSSVRDKALTSTEADEEDSGTNSRPTTRSSTETHDDGVQPSSKPGRKRRITSAVDGNPKPNKKARASGNGNANTDASDGGPKARAKNMVEVAPGEWKSTQSVMMAARWAAYRADPSGPRIGRIRKSQETGSDANSSRKHSLEDNNDQAETSRASKKRKLTKEEPAEEENGIERSEYGSQAPTKGKRGGRREGSGRKPAKGSFTKGRRQYRTERSSREELEAKNSGHHDRVAHTPPAGNEAQLDPSSGSTRISTRARKPSIAKLEADDGMPPNSSSQLAKKVKGQWGGKREKGKRNDGTPIMKSKQSAKSRVSIHPQEGAVDMDRAEDDDGHSQEEEDEDDGEEEEEEEQTPGPQKKPGKRRKGRKSSASPGDDYPNLPVYSKSNPSAEYLALPKNLKMKSVSRARWRTGGMRHMFGQKGPNKTTKQKFAQTTSNTASINSVPTSVSGTNSAPPNARRRSLIRSKGEGSGDDSDANSGPAALKRKISEYEEFQALTSVNQESGGKRGRRPAAMRASTSFVEPKTSSESEDEDAGNGDDDNKPSASTENKKEAEKPKTGPGSRKGIGGRPPKSIRPIQTDIANTEAGSAKSSAGGRTLTAYEEWQAISQPGSPLVLEKRARRPAVKRRGGDLEAGARDEEYEEYEGADDDFME